MFSQVLVSSHGYPMVLQLPSGSSSSGGGGGGGGIGGYLPLPDYWIALLHKKLLGQRVLSVKSSSQYLRAYAHCARPAGGGGGVLQPPTCHGTLQATCSTDAAKRRSPFASKESCGVCAGHRQHELRTAGCTHEDIQHYCAEETIDALSVGGGGGGGGGVVAMYINIDSQPTQVNMDALTSVSGGATSSNISGSGSW